MLISELVIFPLPTPYFEDVKERGILGMTLATRTLRGDISPNTRCCSQPVTLDLRFGNQGRPTICLSAYDTDWCID